MIETKGMAPAVICAFHAAGNALISQRLADASQLDVSRPVVAAAPTGGRVLLAAQLAKIALRIASAAGLARLLMPEDYGLHGMAAFFYGLLHIVRELGLVAAMQQPGIHAGRFAQAAKLAACGGAGLAVAGILLSWPAAWFYGVPAVQPVVAVMSVGLLLGAVAAPAVGLLYRTQQFAKLARIEVAAHGAGVVVALGAAWHGAGVWALVAMALTADATTAALIWLARPQLPSGSTGPGWRELLGFSASLSAHSVAHYTARGADHAAVGWWQGPAPLGVYGRGAQLAMLPTQLLIAPYTGWAVAQLARVRDEPKAYVERYAAILRGLLHVAGAAAVVCAAVPELLITTLFGSRWLDAAPLLRALALGAVVQPLLLAPIWVLESTGRATALARISFGAMLVSLTACLVAAPFGALAVAWAWSLACVAHATAGLACCADARLPLRALFAPAVRPLLAHGGVLAAFGALRWWLPEMPAEALFAAVAATGYGLALGMSAQLREDLRGHVLWRR